MELRDIEFDEEKINKLIVDDLSREDMFNIILAYRKELRRKEEECEDWKNKYYASTTEVKADLIKQLDELRETFNNAIELSKIYKKQIFKSSEKKLKYSQALQEIKGLSQSITDEFEEMDTEQQLEYSKQIAQQIVKRIEVLDADVQS